MIANNCFRNKVSFVLNIYIKIFLENHEQKIKKYIINALYIYNSLSQENKYVHINKYMIYTHKHAYMQTYWEIIVKYT